MGTNNLTVIGDLVFYFLWYKNSHLFLIGSFALCGLSRFLIGATPLMLCIWLDSTTTLIHWHKTCYHSVSIHCVPSLNRGNVHNSSLVAIEFGGRKFVSRSVSIWLPVGQHSKGPKYYKPEDSTIKVYISVVGFLYV